MRCVGFRLSSAAFLTYTGFPSPRGLTQRMAVSLLKEVWQHTVPYGVSASALAASPPSLRQNRDGLTLSLLLPPLASLGNM